MKRMLIVVLCALCVFSLTGCQMLLDVLVEQAVAPATNVVARNKVASMPDTGAMVLYEAADSYMAAPGAGGVYGAYSMPETSYEEYAALSDPGFVSPKTRPLSTFAADVDTAAYANIRRMIMAQQVIPPDAVRIEEFVNAFSYHDPAPTADDPVAIAAQVAACPWNEDHLLMRVALKAREIEADHLPASNLVFLIDTSGSMESADKLPLVKRSFSLLVEQLQADDRVSIVTYAGSSNVVLEGVRGDEQATILAAIADLTAWGGTNGADGIETAYTLAERYAAPGLNSRVILATDGDFNIGINSESELTRLIEQKRNTGIYLTVLGFGMGNIKDNKMQALADHGNGNATYIDTIHQARRALIEEMGATLVTVAKDVKLQMEFNPATVEAYRLIGYENRRLNDEDFADDTKDGGEMGAGHSVVALYELIPAGAGEMKDIGLTYQSAATMDSDDYATVHVRYKEPDGEKSTEITHVVDAAALTDAPSDDFILSAAVTAFGQMLMNSEFRGTADERMILDMLQPMLTNDEGGRIVELSTLVRRSAGLYETGE